MCNTLTYCHLAVNNTDKVFNSDKVAKSDTCKTRNILSEHNNKLVLLSWYRPYSSGIQFSCRIKFIFTRSTITSGYH